MADSKVLGFRNAETAYTYLWIDTDFDRHHAVRKLVTEIDISNIDDCLPETARRRIAYADMLDNWFTSQAPEEKAANIFDELMRTAIQRIDWIEIATSILSSADES